MVLPLSVQKDALQIYMGESLVINDKIQVRQPTMRDIIEIGEQEYFSLLHAFLATPSDYKAKLWDSGILWEEMDNLLFFSMMVTSLPLARTRVLFGELDFTKFQLAKSEDNEYSLINREGGVIFDRYAYLHVCNFLCTCHSLKQKNERAGNEFTRKAMINIDRTETARKKDKEFTSNLQPLISSMVNHAGFKYNLSQVSDLTFYQFMDSVSRITLISSSALYAQGVYTGAIDRNKIDQKALNWLRKIEPKQ